LKQAVCNNKSAKYKAPSLFRNIEVFHYCCTGNAYIYPVEKGYNSNKDK